jgi:hypothetical protein
MKHYLIQCALPEEHVPELVIAAESPEQAFSLWEGFYGHPWPATLNELPPLGNVAQIEQWNSPISFGGDDDDSLITLATVPAEMEQD